MNIFSDFIEEEITIDVYYSTQNKEITYMTKEMFGKVVLHIYKIIDRLNARKDEYAGFYNMEDLIDSMISICEGYINSNNDLSESEGFKLMTEDLKYTEVYKLFTYDEFDLCHFGIKESEKHILNEFQKTRNDKTKLIRYDADDIDSIETQLKHLRM